MNLTETLAYAALQGFTTVMPLSDGGHRVAASLFLGGGREAVALGAFGELGCVAAVAVSLRQRLGRAFGEGIRGIARPAILQGSDGGRDAISVVLAALVAAATDMALHPYASPLNHNPSVAGVGMLLLAAALMSTVFAPPPKKISTSTMGALLVGLAQGLSIVPGASRVGAAFVVLRWLSVGGWRAAELAMLVAMPMMLLDAARVWLEGSMRDPFAVGVEGLSGGQIGLTLAVTFVTGALAAAWWKALCEKYRTAALCLWLVPLSLALLGYARALPEPTIDAPAGYSPGATSTKSTSPPASPIQDR